MSYYVSSNIYSNRGSRNYNIVNIISLKDNNNIILTNLDFNRNILYSISSAKKLIRRDKINN